MGKLEDILRDLWGEAYRAGINSENIKEVLWPEYVRKAKEQILSLILGEKEREGEMKKLKIIKECKCEDKNTDYHLLRCCNPKIRLKGNYKAMSCLNQPTTAEIELTIDDLMFQLEIQRVKIDYDGEDVR